MLVLADGGARISYAYALVQALCEKVSLSFHVPEGDATKNSRGVEKCRKKFG
jgi:hypothetical protein